MKKSARARAHTHTHTHTPGTAHDDAQNKILMATCAFLAWHMLIMMGFICRARRDDDMTPCMPALISSMEHDDDKINMATSSSSTRHMMMMTEPSAVSYPYLYVL
ncbi:hypothetical protein BsWGS_28882 [Bradybaena similaris]